MSGDRPNQPKREAFGRVTSLPPVLGTAPEAPHPDPAQAGLSVIIPAYNALGTIEPLLEQLSALDEVQSGLYEVLITDDASSDDTVSVLRKRYPGFSYLESAVNTGFGQNCNRGIAAARKGYCALVNTDIELCGNPFASLLERLHASQSYFALMPLVYNSSRQQVENLQRLKVTHSLPWNEDLPLHTEFSSQIAAAFESGAARGALLPRLEGLLAVSAMQIINTILCGACFVCQSARLRELGGFDPRFSPCYWEDVDLGARALKIRNTSLIGTLTTSLVIHRHSETINKAHGARKMRYLRLNQLRYSLAHLRPPDPPDTSGMIRSERNKDREERMRAALSDYCWDMRLRGWREYFGGDPELRQAYFRAAHGETTI